MAKPSVPEEPTPKASQVESPEDAATHDTGRGLEIDLPQGQRVTIGALPPGTVLEIISWQGTGAPDASASRLLLGASTMPESQQADAARALGRGDASSVEADQAGEDDQADEADQAVQAVQDADATSTASPDETPVEVTPVDEADQAPTPEPATEEPVNAPTDETHDPEPIAAPVPQPAPEAASVPAPVPAAASVASPPPARGRTWLRRAATPLATAGVVAGLLLIPPAVTGSSWSVVDHGPRWALGSTDRSIALVSTSAGVSSGDRVLVHPEGSPERWLGVAATAPDGTQVVVSGSVTLPGSQDARHVYLLVPWLGWLAKPFEG